MRKYKVYIHSFENGVYQVGHTVYQAPAPFYTRWNATMKGCTKDNCQEIEASSPEEAIKKIKY